MTFLTDCGELL